MIYVSISGDLSKEPPALSQPDCVFQQLHHWKPPLHLAARPHGGTRRRTNHTAHLAAIGPIRSHLVVHVEVKTNPLLT